MFLAERRPCGLLENLHLDPPDILAYPFIEDGTEKITPGLRRNSEGANAGFGIGLRLDHRQKAYIGSFDLLEEPVHFKGVPDIIGINHAQDIGINAMLSQEMVPPYGFLVSGPAVFREAIPVVHFLGPIQAEADGKILRRQEAAPFFIEEGSIGLHPVGDSLVRRLMLALQVDDLAKVVQTQYSRFAAMPGKADHLIGAGFDVLNDVPLQDIILHPKRLVLRIELFLR